MNKRKSKAETMMKKKAFMRTALYNGRNQKTFDENKKKKEEFKQKKVKKLQKAVEINKKNLTIA